MKLNAIAKYGTFITAGVLLVIGVMCWFIKYPETVPTKSKLTGTNAPKPLIAKQNLRLVHLFKKNYQEVQQGELIGVLETTANFSEVQKLERMLDTIISHIQQGSIGQIKGIMQQPFNHLGELQTDYQSFIQTYLPYRDYVLGDYTEKRKQLLQKDLSIANRSKTVLHEQEVLQQRDLGLSQTTIDKNKKLLDDKLISEQEYRELSSQYINKQMSEPQMKSSYISNESQINSINKELVELDKNILTQKSLFQLAVLQLKTQIDLWKQNYMLIASSNGKIIFTTFLQENQNLEAGSVVAHVIPAKSDIYLETLVPQANFGKVATGQKVILKFDAYPWQEFGAVMGKIEYISPVPLDSGFYLAKVILPNDLKTNYNKKIPFVEGLIAQSEIVTKDLRLSESLFYDFVKTFKK